MRLAGHRDEGHHWRWGGHCGPPLGQAPWLIHKSSPEVPDIVCREVKCPTSSMLAILERLAAELGADRGTRAHGRNRANGRDRNDGSAGDDGRAKPVTGQG